MGSAERRPRRRVPAFPHDHDGGICDDLPDGAAGADALAPRAVWRGRHGNVIRDRQGRDRNLSWDRRGWLLLWSGRIIVRVLTMAVLFFTGLLYRRRHHPSERPRRKDRKSHP